MTNLEIIQELRESTFIDEDGQEFKLEFQKGLTKEEIEDYKSQFPNKTIDPELIEILRVTSGWEGYGPSPIIFDNATCYGYSELTPNATALAHDGFGNYWVLDLDDNGNLGKVFFSCHDPAVIVLNSQSLNEFLFHLLEFYKDPSNNHLNEIHDKTAFSIWKSGGSTVSKKEFINANPEFRIFLSKYVGDNWTIADLRKSENKDGFAWGKYGPNQLIERHPSKLIWVIKNKKQGIFARFVDKNR